MTDQTPNLAALEALAEAILNGWRPMNVPEGSQSWWQAETLVRRGWMSDNDAKFVAAADPATVLWLIREVRRLDREVRHLRPSERRAGAVSVQAQARAEKAEAELASIRAAARPDRFRCCECCKTEHLAEGREGDDDLIDNHTIACQHCQDPEKRRAEKAEATIERVRAALANHPRACEAHPDDDPISCGWKRTVLDVQTALDGGESR